MQVTPHEGQTRGTSRIKVADESDQRPPIVTPSRARATIRKAKLGAGATSTSDAPMQAVSATSTWRRSKRLAMVAISRLVTTANRPEMEIACPAMPSVA